MRKLLFLLFAGLLVWGIGCQKDALFDIQNQVDTKVTSRDYPPEVKSAINAGIDWMLAQQQPDGYFYSTYEGVARTALAVTKLCDRSLELGFMPDEGPYAVAIADGLTYILQQASTHPDGGIRLNSNPPDHDVYNTGIGMMGLAAYRCPDCIISSTNALVDGQTFQWVLQKNVEFFEAVQNPDGGWIYSAENWPSDNSNSGFAALGLLAAVDAGCTVDATVLSNFSTWLDFIQNDVSGGSGYRDPNDWVNILKTGNLLFEFGLVGDAPNSPRVLAALDYIQNTWNVPNDDPGWRPNNYLAMYCLMKGFVSMGIDEINVGGPHDWYQEFVTVLLGDQQPGGYWNGSYWIDEFLATAFNLLTIEKIAPLAIFEVYFDIHPTSCPNPINRKSKGVTPMAILGTADFDVSDINLATVNIQGINPVMNAMEDVTTPYIPGPNGLEDEYSCTTEGPDGLLDLTLKFSTQELAGLLAGYEVGDVVVLTVEGELNDGRLFRGEDIIKIVK